MASHIGSVEEMKNIFNKFDKDGDGKISFDELKEILSGIGTTPSADEMQKTLSELDKDGDGFVDLEEFIAFHSKSSDDSKELKEVFDMYDLDKNGLISATELLAVMKRLGETCSLSDCRRMIAQVDNDGDGNVDFEEFKKMMVRG